MDAAADRPEFAPPQEPAAIRGFALAVLAHLILLYALMHGLHWQRETPDAVAEAELWSTLPREAAPKPVEVTPAPPPPPPPPQPVVKAPPEPPVQKPDINLEREKQKRELEKKREAELERERQLEAQRKLDEQRRLEAQKKHEQELAKKKQQEKLLAEARRKEEEQKRKEEEKRRVQQEQQAKLAKQVREEQIRRMQALAGTGSPSATGNSAHSAGPSASWGAKVQARVRPNIVFTDDVPGNPKAEVEVRTSPDGTIVGKRLVRSSGVPSWDQAVLRALDKTGSLPRDIDGRVPSPVVIEFRPRG